MTLVSAQTTGMSELEQHQALIDEIQSIRVERGFNARSELILAKWEIGRAVIQSPLYERHKRGVGEFIKKIGLDVGYSWRSIYDCCKFYNAAEAAGGLTDFLYSNGLGKEISWNSVLRCLPKTGGEVSEEEQKRLARHKPETRSDRASACRYALRRVNKEWREEDQDKLLKFLGLYQID